MTEPRPRPQYGEYASPEDQAKAAGLEFVPPVADTDVADKASKTDKADKPTRPTRPAKATTPAVYAPPTVTPTTPIDGTDVDGAAASASSRPRRNWDQLLTGILLAFGAVSVFTAIPQYLNLGGVLSDVFEQFGTAEFTSIALANQVGIALNVIQLVLFVVTVVISIQLLRKNRIAFYVPVIGGVLCGIITLILMAVVMSSDPAFIDYVMQQG